MAYPNDSSRIAQGIENLETAVTTYTGTDPAVRRASKSLIRKTYCITEVAAVYANGDNAIVANAAPSIYFKNPVNVLGVTIQNRTALTHSAANVQTFSLQAVSNNGVIGNTIANAVTKAVANSGTGTLAPGQKFSLTVISANSRVMAGTFVGVAIAPSSSGVAVGATSWAIDVEEEGADGYAV